MRKLKPMIISLAAIGVVGALWVLLLLLLTVVRALAIETHFRVPRWVTIFAAKRLFKIWRFTIGAPRAVLVRILRGSLRLHSFLAPHTNFCESAGRLEKPKSGEISDVLVLKVGDRGATAVCHTSYFHDSLYRLGWIVIRKSLQIDCGVVL